MTSNQCYEWNDKFIFKPWIKLNISIYDLNHHAIAPNIFKQISFANPLFCFCFQPCVIVTVIWTTLNSHQSQTMYILQTHSMTRQTMSSPVLTPMSNLQNFSTPHTGKKHTSGLGSEFANWWVSYRTKQIFSVYNEHVRNGVTEMWFWIVLQILSWE